MEYTSIVRLEQYTSTRYVVAETIGEIVGWIPTHKRGEHRGKQWLGFRATEDFWRNRYPYCISGERERTITGLRFYDDRAVGDCVRADGSRDFIGVIRGQGTLTLCIIKGRGKDKELEKQFLFGEGKE